MNARTLRAELRAFKGFGTATREDRIGDVAVFENEFWTARQRQSHSLHEISYRACFKAELPRFFIERLSRPGATILDPFMGRGTTLIEAALLGRRAIGTDINPLGPMLAAPRLHPPDQGAIAARLARIDWQRRTETPAGLRAFFHRDTLREIGALRAYFLDREARATLDAVDGWLRMVALNRLTGHSSGFFSVYTLPPNQAVSVASQRRINARRKQVPAYRDVAALMLRKSKALLKDCIAEPPVALAHRCLVSSATELKGVARASVDLVVTSPPFLDIVSYRQDNWLRCWFAGIDPASVDIAHHRRIEDWRAFVGHTFGALARVVKPGGHVAFEVGEVRGGRVALEAEVLAAVGGLPFRPLMVMINRQRFTKTANTWGIANNAKGTNSNRIVVLERC